MRSQHPSMAGTFVFLFAASLAGCVSQAARRQGIEGTSLLRLGIATRLEMKHERTDRRAEKPQRQRLLTAGLDVDADVSVYDSRLLHATIAGTIAQSHAKARGPQDGTDTASVPRYYVRADAFRNRTVSGHVLAERDDDRTFSRARFIRSSIERQEAGVVARTPEYRGYVTVRQSTTDVRGIDSDGDRSLDGRFLSLGGEVSDGNSRTTVDMDVTDLDEDPISANSTGRDDRTRRIDIANTFRTNADEGWPDFRFMTTAQFWNQRTIDDRQKRERYSEDVQIDLSDDFSSRTNAEYRTFSNGFDTQNKSVLQEFRYSLFDSLVSTVGGFRNRDEFDDGQTDRYGMNATLDYRKDVAFGELRAGFSMARQRQEDDFAASTRAVFGEGIVLRTGRTTFLDQPNVLESTVVVRDATGTITYVENVDYELRSSGIRTEIRRVITGLIPDGTLVRVDYEYESSGDLKFETRTRTARFGVRILDTLNLYTRKTRRRQRELQGDGTNQLEDSDTTIYGAEFDWRDFRITGERELHRADFSPFKERRGSASYDFDIGKSTRVGLFTRHSRTEFDEGDDLRVRSYGGTLTYMPTRDLRIEGQPVWQEERGRGSDLDILDVRVRATYSIGKVDVELLVDHREQSRDTSRESDTRIILSVIREW